MRAASQGDPNAQEELTALIYDELRRRAASYMRRERRDHTLQPTAVVHELYIRLADQRIEWRSKAHFFGVASLMLRRYLREYARRRAAMKRDPESLTVNFHEPLFVAARQPRAYLRIDLALSKLAETHPRAARVVELRFWADMNEAEIAELLDVSVKTVQRDWGIAKTFIEETLKNRS